MVYSSRFVLKVFIFFPEIPPLTNLVEVSKLRIISVSILLPLAVVMGGVIFRRNILVSRFVLVSSSRKILLLFSFLVSFFVSHILILKEGKISQIFFSWALMFFLPKISGLVPARWVGVKGEIISFYVKHNTEGVFARLVARARQRFLEVNTAKDR